MTRLKAFSACDGMACAKIALESLDVDAEYIAIEIDKNVRLIADTNFPDIKRPVDDVYLVTKDLVKKIGSVDIFFAGTECTSLSSQGKRDEWDGKSKIFFQVALICEWFKELNPDMLILFENVASMRIVAREEMSKVLGMRHFKGLSAFTSGQGRERYYWFNWINPEITDAGIIANDALEDDGLHIVAFTKSNRNKPGEKQIIKGRQRRDNKSATITTGKGGVGRSTVNFVITKKLQIRYLTVRECARLQNIPDWYRFDMVSDSIAHKAIGNGWEIKMITEILKGSNLCK